MIFRPRRFGKSLFISLMKAFYEGNRAAFEGTAIMDELCPMHFKYREALKEYELKLKERNKIIKNLSDAEILDLELNNKVTRLIKPIRPFNPLYYSSDVCQVVSLDFSGINIDSGKHFLKSLIFEMNRILQKKGLETINKKHIFEDFIKKFINILSDNSPSKKIVFLFDEYDSPIINSVGSTKTKKRTNKKITRLMYRFLTCIKTQEEYIKFSFLTGCTHMSILGLFSGPNTYKNYSFSPEYAQAFGITETELRTSLRPYVQNMVDRINMNHEKYNKGEKGTLDIDGAIALMKREFNGFEFAGGGCNDTVLPTLSVVDSLHDGVIRDSFTSSGTITNLAKMVGTNLKSGKSMSTLFKNRTFSLFDLENAYK